MRASCVLALVVLTAPSKTQGAADWMSPGHSRSNSSDEIPFAQFNTAVPQDVVGRGAVEIKVGRHEMHQIGWPLKLIVCSPRVRVPDPHRQCR